MPSVHKCLKHIRKNATSFNLRIPYIDSTGSVWRKIFPRSNSSDTSRSPKSSGSSNNGSAAPQIDTLNMTRASLILEKKDMPKFPSAIQRKETAMGRETPSSQVMDYDTSEKVGDVERGTPASLAREQRRDDSNSERNETTRAQYEFHPRRTVYWRAASSERATSNTLWYLAYWLRNHSRPHLVSNLSLLAFLPFGVLTSPSL